MKISQYLFYVSAAEDTVIVRQMLEGSLIKIDPVAASWLQQGQIDCFEDEERELLVNQGFIIPNEIDEGKEFVDNYKRLWAETDELLLNILPTTNCQLICPYCYEDGICRTRTMDKHIENTLLDWIRSYLTKEGISKIRIVWFGGEPLLRKGQIIRLCHSLRNICSDLRTEIKSQIVTNGVLLDKDVLSCLQQTGLNRLQITLDGSPGFHNKKRFIRKTGRGTFDQIHKGILLALQGEYIEKVDIRVNIDRLNYQDIEELFSILAADAIQDQINLSIGPITDTIQSESCANDASNYFKENGLQGDEIVTAYLHTARVAKKHGFNAPKV